jgi:hypothetical protein
MSRRFATIFLLLITSQGFCQKFGISDLGKMVTMGDDEFDTYATSKGFHFNINKTDTNSTRASYHFDGKQYKSEFTLDKFKYINGNLSITYNLIDKSVYLNIKNQAKKLGYTLSKTIHEDDATWFVYSKNNWRLVLINSTKYTTAGQDIGGGYEITLTKLHQ